MFKDNLNLDNINQNLDSHERRTLKSDITDNDRSINS